MTEPKPARRPRVDYTAPILSVDLAAEGWEIWPCHDCYPWHLEIVRDEDGEIVAREWHAVDCPTLAVLLDNQTHED